MFESSISTLAFIVCGAATAVILFRAALDVIAFNAADGFDDDI